MSELLPRRDALAAYHFHQGTNSHAYAYLGAHLEEGSVVFRVWAPNAEAVFVCGDFNGWAPTRYPMRRVSTAGIYECRIAADQIPIGSLYKFYFLRDGRGFYKADPFGFSMGCPPETASVFYVDDDYPWKDAGWLRYRAERFTREAVARQPINIYEMHLGSWMRADGGEPLSYPEIARQAAPYLKQMGYTHIQLLPIGEFSSEDSLGYGVCGYYAPSARYGTPRDLMALVDLFHEAGIGVILDWVPTHFPRDEHGLREFDGAPLYEQAHEGRWEGADGSLRFDLSREEVRSFLVSNAVYWISRFHVDGLRISGIAELMREGGGNPPAQRRAAAEFFRALNGTLAKEYPDVFTLADASEDPINVTDFSDGGLGFTLRQNTQWTRDTLFYASMDPIWRKHHHGLLNYPITYAFSQRYLLSISRESVWERPLCSQLFGDKTMQEAGVRLLLLYQITHPGKKSLFMGSEWGMRECRDHRMGLPWETLSADLQYYTACLNRFYLRESALWQGEEAYGRSFVWIDPDNGEQSILSYRRRDENGNELIVILNFTPVRRDDFLLAVPEARRYREIFNSDSVEFGGSGAVNFGEYPAEPCPTREGQSAIRITVPPMGGAVLQAIPCGLRQMP
ncbi:MAG: 1,4-alpha-glucan branching enzyme [Ruminococcaceae bacterium]|nr:1,4-alpha-glucan branching enzyme [Oscillospiraceae bacterium]